MALTEGNPFQKEVNNLPRKEILRRVHGMFKNWFSFGEKQDYASAVPSLLGLEPQNVLDFEPINRINSGSGGATITLTNSTEDDIIICTAFTASSDANFDVEFVNGSGTTLFGPVFGSANSTVQIDDPSTIVPNKKQEDLDITITTTGTHSLMIQGARLTLQSTSVVELETGS